MFFNNMVLVLDAYFCHRSRTIEGKDGNPWAGESLMDFSTVITLYSMLKYQVGDEIKLNEAEFVLLSKAFFAEIENKYL